MKRPIVRSAKERKKAREADELRRQTARAAVGDLDDRLLDTNAMAAFLGLHPVTPRKWRRAGAGPEWIVLPSGHIRYSLAELRRWAHQGDAA